jgi:hypothetical protein
MSINKLPQTASNSISLVLNQPPTLRFYILSEPLFVLF